MYKNLAPLVWLSIIIVAVLLALYVVLKVMERIAHKREQEAWRAHVLRKNDEKCQEEEMLEMLHSDGVKRICSNFTSTDCYVAFFWEIAKWRYPSADNMKLYDLTHKLLRELRKEGYPYAGG